MDLGPMTPNFDSTEVYVGLMRHPPNRSYIGVALGARSLNYRYVGPADLTEDDYPK